jgi:hypothetical protein
MIRHGHQPPGFSPHRGLVAVLVLYLEGGLGPSHVLEMTESRLSSRPFPRDMGLADEEPEERLGAVASLGNMVVGTLSLFRWSPAGDCRRSDVLLVELVMTVPFADVDVEGTLEPLLPCTAVLSFLDLSLLRILFLPMVRGEMLLL